MRNNNLQHGQVLILIRWVKTLWSLKAPRALQHTSHGLHGDGEPDKDLTPTITSQDPLTPMPSIAQSLPNEDTLSISLPSHLSHLSPISLRCPRNIFKPERILSVLMH